MRAATAYASIGSGESADVLVRRHAELVKRIAYHLAGRLPPSVDVDDLMQAGMLGLLEAASHYAADRGASFETYAGIRRPKPADAPCGALSVKNNSRIQVAARPT